jgi:protein SCO1/2
MSDPSLRPSFSEQERASLFRGESAALDRAAALRAGSDKVPRKVIVWMCVGFLILGVGGVILEHYFGDAGLASSTPVTTLAGLGPTSTIPSGPQITGSLNAFIGLKRLGAESASDVILATQKSQRWSLANQLGHVVVLTFYDSQCDDVCTVVRAEMSAAQVDLGAHASRVEFVAINTDPFHTSVSSDAPAISADLPKNFVFLNGPLRTLNAVWASYGVTVTVGNNNSQLAHNDICYVIDAHGRLRDQLVPFANEDPSGRYSLPATQIARFGAGIAHVVSSL